MVLVQLVLFLLAGLGSIIPLIDTNYMMLYYAVHPLLILVTYYSNSFLSAELAKLINPAQIKVFFYILNFSTFSLQCLMNILCEGIGFQPQIDACFRYIVITVFMGCAFFVVMFGLGGSSSAKAVDAEKSHKATNQDIDEGESDEEIEIDEN